MGDSDAIEDLNILQRLGHSLLGCDVCFSSLKFRFDMHVSQIRIGSMVDSQHEWLPMLGNGLITILIFVARDLYYELTMPERSTVLTKPVAFHWYCPQESETWITKKVNPKHVLKPSRVRYDIISRVAFTAACTSWGIDRFLAEAAFAQMTDN